MNLKNIITAAANAIRHGLSGTRHVPKEAEADLAQIEADLVAIKEPETPEEQEIVRDMSIAAWQVGEHDRRQVEHLQLQIARASGIFDAKELDKFEALQAKWLADPAAHAEAMSNSYLGVKHFAHIWKAISESLGPDGTGLSLKMTCQAVAAEGISPHPDEIFGQGNWLMKRFLATTASPTDSVHEWLDKYGARKSKVTSDRAERLCSAVPDAVQSHAELHAHAQERYRFWANLMEKRRNDYDLAKMQFTSANAGNGMGDREMENQVWLMHRYRTAAQNRMEKLDRQLKASKADRARTQQKLYLREQREKEGKIRKDLQIARLSDRQFRQYSEQLDYEENREIRPAQPNDHSAFDDGQMKIQSQPASTAGLQALLADEPRPEMKISIAPRPVADPHVTDAEIQELINDCFTKKPHEGMFSGWPVGAMSKDVVHRAGLMLPELCKDKAESRQIQFWLVQEYGRRMIHERMNSKAQEAHEALLKEPHEHKARGEFQNGKPRRRD